VSKGGWGGGLGLKSEANSEWLLWLQKGVELYRSLRDNHSTSTLLATKIAGLLCSRVGREGSEPRSQPPGLKSEATMEVP